MKVLLIQPKMRQRPMDTSLKARMSPHLGLLTISGLLERAGHGVRVANGNVEPVEIPSDVDLVGISVTVDVLPQAIELAKICRAKGVLVVAEGGGNAVVIRDITEAIQALFGVEAHKIKIMKRTDT